MVDTDILAAAVGTSDVALRRQEDVAAGTKAFHFDKPPGFVFRPGQALDLILPMACGTDEAARRHTFSIVSAPFEDELVIATRMRHSVFKNTLNDLAMGALARVEGPFGSLTLHKDRTRAAVLVAGGIGITPFVSMLRQAVEERSTQRLVLMYSNRRPADAAFLGELQALAARHPNLGVIPTMTEVPVGDGWSGQTGAIDEAFVKRVAGELAQPIYYLAGPPAMVASLRQIVERSGVDSDDIRSEDFFGY